MKESNNNIKQNRLIYPRLGILIVRSLTSTQCFSIARECGILLNNNQLFLSQERIALPVSEKGLDALSFGFSYDFLQESKGMFQIFILPSNFQPFRATSRSAFAWSVAIVSQMCIHAIFTQRTARGFWLKKYVRGL